MGRHTRFKLESQIQKKLRLSNDNTAHFDYSIRFDDGKIELNIYTYNSNHNDYILLCGPLIGQKPEDVLLMGLEYLNTHNIIKKDDIPLKIRWKKKSESNFHTSYFYDTKEEAIKKLLKNKSVEDIEYFIELVPIS